MPCLSSKTKASLAGSTVGSLRFPRRQKNTITLFYRYQTAMFGVIVSQGVFYYFYQFFMEVFMRLRRVELAKRLTWLDNLLISAIAGVFTATFTNPIWVINTRMQIAKSKTVTTQASTLTTTAGNTPLPTNVKPNTEPEQRKNVLETLKDIIQERGASGLFAGLVPSYASLAPFWLAMAFKRGPSG